MYRELSVYSYVDDWSRTKKLGTWCRTKKISLKNETCISLRKLDCHTQEKKKKMKLDPYHTPYTKLNSIWVKDMSYSLEFIKYIEENESITLQDIDFTSTFSDSTPLTKTTKMRNKWKYHKLKKVKHGKEIWIKIQRHHRKWNKIVMYHKNTKI